MDDKSGTVTILVTHRLKEGREADFHAWLQSINKSVKKAVGFRRLDIVQQSTPNAHEVGVIVRFDDHRSLEDWHQTEEFQQFRGQLDEFVEHVSNTEITGFEQWFVPPSTSSDTPSRLKQSIVILIGIYPLSLALPPVLNPIMARLALPEALKALIFSALMVGLMTWAIMPLLNRALSRWLYPTK